MKRRTVLQFAAAALAAPARTFAQSGRRYRVGCLYIADLALIKPFQDAFVAGMRERGYVEGQNLTIDLRSAGGENARLGPLVDELIALKPDVLFGIESVAVVMKSKTSTIPIVVPSSNDPVTAGLAKSLARPGFNVTGLGGYEGERVGKEVELLAEINPRMKRVALLNDPTAPAAAQYEHYARLAAAAKNLGFIVVSARNSEEVRRAFETIEKERAEAVVVAGTGLTNHLRRDILAQARRLRLPTSSALPANIWIESGGTISNGVNLVESFRYSASYVARILKGAKPSELPIERPTIFELVVNVKATRDIGLVVPPSVLLRADRVIE